MPADGLVFFLSNQCLQPWKQHYVHPGPTFAIK
jgi:hypothetical protein